MRIIEKTLWKMGCIFAVGAVTLWALFLLRLYYAVIQSFLIPYVNDALSFEYMMSFSSHLWKEMPVVCFIYWEAIAFPIFLLLYEVIKWASKYEVYVQEFQAN